MTIDRLIEELEELRRLHGGMALVVFASSISQLDISIRSGNIAGGGGAPCAVIVVNK